MKTNILAILAFVLLAGNAYAGTANFLECVDEDRDGRFSLNQIVHSPPAVDARVIMSNYGSYPRCRDTSRFLENCSDDSVLCACEDRDNDGRFGVVLRPGRLIRSNVVASNLGDYQQCRQRLRSYENTNDTYHTCDDYDNDGRFGIVQHWFDVQLEPATLAHNNYGPYQSCVEYAQSFRGCQRPGYCGCVDNDDDGRFSIYIMPGEVVRVNHFDHNLGNYQACFRRMNFADGWLRWYAE